MSYLSQKCLYETGGRRHSLSFPQRKKKVTDPEEVTNLTGWVTLSLRLEWEQPSTWCSVFQWLAQQHLFKALSGSWNERDSLIPEPSWERSPSLISSLFTVRSSDCPLTGSDGFSFILVLSLSPLSHAGNTSVGTACCSVDVPVIFYTVVIVRV